MYIHVYVHVAQSVSSIAMVLPCLISALLMPTLAIPETGPEFSRVATAIPVEATTAPDVPGGCVFNINTIL